MPNSEPRICKMFLDLGTTIASLGYHDPEPTIIVVGAHELLLATGIGRINYQAMQILGGQGVAIRGVYVSTS